VTSKGTTHRTVRIPDSIWIPAQDRAEQEHTNLSAVMRDALARYAHNQEEAK